MLINRPAPFALTLTGILCLGALSAALAAPTVSSISFAAHGDLSEGSVSAPLPLSPRSFLCAAEGADGAFSTADDVVLLVNDVGNTPTVTALSTPYLSDYSGRLVRLSATRAMAISGGVDGAFSTADDAVLVLNQLGSTNTVTSVVVGAIDDLDGFSPVALSTSTAVIASLGLDLTVNTVDDRFMLLQGLDGASPTTTPIAAPGLDFPQTRITTLTPTSFLVASNGADLTRTTADDKILLFTDVGGANTRTDISVPDLPQRAPRLAVRLSPTSAIITSAGPDHVETTADDRLVYLNQLGTLNTVTPVPVPNIHNYSGGQAIALSATSVTVVTEGPDSVQTTVDDQLAVVTGLGVTNTVTLISVGSTDEDQVSRGTRLSPTRVALGSGGTTSPSFNNADDEVIVIDNVGTTNNLTHFVVPGLAAAVPSVCVPLSNSAFLINHGGPNQVIGTGSDDRVGLIDGSSGILTISNVEAVGHFDPGSSSTVSQPLGRGRAVFVSPGLNNSTGSGGDDLLRVISDLPQVRGIEVQKLSVAYQANRPSGPETFSASGKFRTDDPTAILGADLTVSVGNFSQTVAISRFKRSRTGVYTYADPKHRSGAITKLTVDPRKGKFSVSGKGTGTGLRANLAAYVPVSISGAREHFADAVTARGIAKGLRFP